MKSELRPSGVVILGPVTSMMVSSYWSRVDAVLMGPFLQDLLKKQRVHPGGLLVVAERFSRQKMASIVAGRDVTGIEIFAVRPQPQVFRQLVRQDLERLHHHWVVVLQGLVWVMLLLMVLSLMKHLVLVFVIQDGL